MDESGTSEVSKEAATKAEELKNKANECFKGVCRLCWPPRSTVLYAILSLQNVGMTLLLITTPRP